MASNQDKADAILDQMEKDNDPQALTEGLTILCKLTANIIQQPFEQKFRSIKTTNNTIKNKIMSLRGIDQLLTTLGFTRQNEEMYHLDDERFYLFIEGEPAIDYRRRLATAKQSSPAEYAKELSLVQIHRQQRADKLKRDEETRKLKELAKYDNLERKHMKVDETKSNDLKFGSNTKTCKEMGIGVPSKGGKGG